MRVEERSALQCTIYLILQCSGWQSASQWSEAPANSHNIPNRLPFTGNQDGLCWTQKGEGSQGSHCLPQVDYFCV